MNKILKMNKGFSLIELMISMTILTIAIFPFMDVITSSTMASIDSKHRYKANHYAKMLMDEIQLKAFDENFVNLPFVSTLTAIGIDDTENTSNGRLNNWDDIDDYNGYEENVIINLDGQVEDQDYYRIVKVNYVNDEDLKTNSDENNSRTKKVIVKCYSIDDNRDDVNENNDKPTIKLTWYNKR